VLQDTECQVVPWNERQAWRMRLLFAPTIGAAVMAGHWFQRVRRPPAAPPATSICGHSIGAATWP
jgi:hypothetical protein